MGLTVVTEADFPAEVLSPGLPVLVDFSADWCTPCRMLAPVLAELAIEFDGRLRIVTVDTDAEEALVRAYGIRSVPTMAFFRNGELLRMAAGGRPKGAVRELIEDVLAG